jgi:hypothetical protein
MMIKGASEHLSTDFLLAHVLPINDERDVVSSNQIILCENTYCLQVAMSGQ